jgi:lysophospholipid acyltransferase (LPLAT)-like uncharacterized protein
MVVKRGPSDLSGESFKIRFLINGLAPIAYLIYKQVYRSTKKFWINKELEDRFEGEGRPVIWAHYHYWDAFYLFNFQNHRHAILCGDRWGGILGANMMARVGIETVRRTTRTDDPKSPGFISGEEALGELIKMVTHEKYTAAVSVDGPRGPIFSVKKGVIDLAEETGAPILSMSVATYPRWTVSTWDNMPLPVPFAKVVYIYGGPFFVPNGAGEKAKERIKDEIESHMIEIKDICERASLSDKAIDDLIAGRVLLPSLGPEGEF